MMLSMTGFGRAEANLDNGCFLTVEITSINRKQLEIRLVSSPEFLAVEPVARKIVATHFNRGSVQVRLTVRRSTTAGEFSGAMIDEAMLDSLVAGVMQARKRHGLPESAVAVEELLALPGVIIPRESAMDDPGFAAVFEQTLAAACVECRRMRKAEGEALLLDLRRRKEVLHKLLAELEPECAKLPETAKKRLLGKLADSGVTAGGDDEMLIREVLFYADKSDVSEEITRLKSHFSQMDKFLDSDRPAGRSLDFLVQEFFREITTLGNKAASPAVSPLVVAFKSELEKMREQIQNVE